MLASRRHRRFMFVVATLVMAGIFFVGGYIVLPPPPSTVVLSTGIEGGAYALFGERYRAILARERVTLRTLSSTGSVENLKRLLDRSVRVDLGFVQDGTVSPSEAKNLVSLGAVCYTPLWVFYRGPDTLDDLSRLKGKRIAVGLEGSGVRKLAIELLRAGKTSDPPTQLVSLQGAAANRALLEGSVDAVMITGTEDNALVRELLYTSGVKLMSFREAEAYTRLFPALSHVTLPAGILDLSQQTPPEDVELLAVTTSLIARKDLHPAMIYLLMDAAVETHGRPGWVNRRGEFPAAKEMEVPLSVYAERFYKSGRPFVLDYLPFRVATIVDRLVIVLVPLAFVWAPIMYVGTTIYTWRNRRKIYSWYRALQRIERETARSPRPEEAETLTQELDRIDESLSGIRVPFAYFHEVYRLKEHVELVRGKLARLAPPGAAPLAGRPDPKAGPA